MGFLESLKANLDSETWLPELYKEFAGISALSIVMNRGAYLHYSKRRIYPNTYIMLIGSSGTGKGVTIDNVVRALIEEIDPELILGDSATPEALLDVLSKKSKGAILVDEATMIISKRDYMNEMSGYLTYLYNSHKDHIVIRRRGKDRNYIIEYAYLNLLLGVQPSIMHRIISFYDIASGFLQRFYLVYADAEEEKEVRDDDDTWEESIRLLREVYTFFNTYVTEMGAPLKMQLSGEAQVAIRDYIKKIDRLYRDEELPVFSRWRDLVLKLAILYHVNSLSENLAEKRITLPLMQDITLGSVLKAIETMEKLRKSVESIVEEVLKTQDRRISDRFERQIKKCEPLKMADGWYIYRRELLRRTGYTIEKAQPYIHLLEEEGYIENLKVEDKKVLFKIDKSKWED